MSRRARRRNEVDFDLANVRKMKRLTKRVLRGLEAMEAYMLRFRREKQQLPTAAEAAAATALYAADTTPNTRKAYDPETGDIF